MLSQADVSVVLEASTALTSLGLEAAFLVPTRTGLEKSIMDATAPVRDYLRRTGAHNYEQQGQGEEHKVLLPAFFVGVKAHEATRASLYRPTTKFGDPRVWFSRLPSYADAGQLLLVFAAPSRLYIVNASRADVWATRSNPASPLGQLLGELSARTQSAAVELLANLRAVAARGFIPTVRAGDTGVGATLEHMLGIQTNSSKAPDFKGIEIKATRKLGKGRGNRVNLFSQVPNWEASKRKNGMDLIRHHGYPRSAPARLCCTVADRPNAQGLYLQVDDHKGLLRGMSTSDAGSEEVCQWALEKLHERLREKHNETFWVKADAQKSAEGRESFHYVEVEHTRAPIVSALAPLLATGVITLDFTLKLKPSGSTRDHGYLFKIQPANLAALFPPSVRRSLLNPSS